jgi:kumamolisin
MITMFYRTAIAAAALGMVGVAAAVAAEPEPADLGSLTQRAGDQAISVTIALKLQDPEGAEATMRQVSTPGDPRYLQFLTPEQFQAQFGPSEATVAGVVAHLRGRGLTVERTTATTLKATGTPAVLERVFQTALHQFEQPATEKAPAVKFRAPVAHPVIPAEIAPAVRAVVGLSTRPVFHPHSRQAPTNLGNMRVEPKAAPDTAAAGNPPGALTVTDFAARYNVDPLYQQGITGAGRTLGIVTLASFTPSDAFIYWNALGLQVAPNRLTVVDVDNGPGAPSDASGSSETTLDVEQAGGIAPGAKIIVYQAPNTDQGYLDAFAAAVQGNQADSISTSWGMWEGFDLVTGQSLFFAQAMHELFVEAALQGQSLFAAAGDFGAYDAFLPFSPPAFNFPLSVDFPASDTAITAGGGTTLPGTQNFLLPTGNLSIDIPTEQVWGWDYLVPLCNALELDPISCGIFPIGGGGVSVFSRVPFYQRGIAGVRTSEPGQALILEAVTPPQTVLAFPANFHGRNVPDVAFNADPLTGYLIVYTSDVNGFGVQTFMGGASFVAPQLNGVTALLGQNAGHRLGFLNPLLYNLSRRGGGRGANTFSTITEGDNWFYSGRDGYSPAAGLGTLNVANLAKATK